MAWITKDLPLSLKAVDDDTLWTPSFKSSTSEGIASHHGKVLRSLELPISSQRAFFARQNIYKGGGFRRTDDGPQIQRECPLLAMPLNLDNTRVQAL